MSLRELTGQMISALELEARALTELTAAMKARRMAFVDMRVSALEQGLESLTAPTESALRAAARREQLTAEFGRVTGNTGRIVLRRLLDQVPHDLRSRLETAGQSASKAALASRIESRVGHRLLEQARRYRESLFGLTEREGAVTYDHRARPAQKAMVGGSFVRGVV